QLWPMEDGRLSLPPMDRLWQELQEMNPDLERRGSKNNCLPSSTLAGLVILAGSIGWIGSLLGAAKAQALTLRPRASNTGLNMVGGSYCSSGVRPKMPVAAYGHIDARQGDGRMMGLLPRGFVAAACRAGFIPADGLKNDTTA